MKIIVQRNQQDFGPYPLAAIQQYVQQGSLLPHDLARDAAKPGDPLVPLSQLLERAGVVVPSSGNPFQQTLQNLKSFDHRIMFPWATISSLTWLRDNRLIFLAAVGLTPAVAIAISPGVSMAYWALALYFSAIWALFFYYLFKTPQVKGRLCFLCFFFTGLVSVSVLLLLQNFPPWSGFSVHTVEQRGLISRFLGMFFLVGLSEELCKSAILFWLVRRPGQLLVPQTVVFYAMISGLGFGIYEGVGYQLNVNRGQGIDQAYLLNIARLTSLPFLHAIWTGLSGYFISFAALHPRKKYGLWFLSLVVPALFHALYNTFGWGILGLGSAFFSVMLLTTYLATVSQMQQSLNKS